MDSSAANENLADGRYFIGGSDARIDRGDDEAALLRLWREKRSEVEPEDLSGNLIVQLAGVTEPLNRHWYKRKPGRHALRTDIPGRTSDYLWLLILTGMHQNDVQQTRAIVAWSLPGRCLVVEGRGHPNAAPTFKSR